MLPPKKKEIHELGQSLRQHGQQSEPKQFVCNITFQKHSISFRATVLQLANGCYEMNEQLAYHLVIITLQSRYLGVGLTTAYQKEQPSNIIAIPKQEQTEIQNTNCGN